MSNVLLSLYLESNILYHCTLDPKYLKTTEIIQTLIKIENQIYTLCNRYYYINPSPYVLREGTHLDIQLELIILLFKLHILSEKLSSFNIFDESKVYQTYYAYKYNLQQLKRFIEMP